MIKIKKYDKQKKIKKDNIHKNNSKLNDQHIYILIEITFN